MGNHPSIPNILVASTNITVICPIVVSLLNKDYITTGLTSLLGIASVSSHLTENHKHNMPGFGFSKRLSYILNKYDVGMASLLGSRMLYMYYAKYGIHVSPLLQYPIWLSLTLIIFCFGVYSEYDQLNPEKTKKYIITHSIWHLGIFTSIGYLLKYIIY